MLKYIAEIKTWFDRINGNSYFSARVFNLKNELIKTIPFQYGYGSHPRDTISKYIQGYEYGLHLNIHGINKLHLCKVHIHDINKMIYFTESKSLKKDSVKWGEE